MNTITNDVHRLSEQPMAKHSTPRVLVIDTPAAADEALRTIIETRGWTPEFFATTAALMSSRFSSAPCCLLLTAGVHTVQQEELQRLRAERAAMPIIVMTSDIPTSVRAMKAGAFHVLEARPAYEDLINAITVALEHSAASLDDEAEMRELQACFRSLTPREKEVMLHVVAGLLNKQVGGELGITEVTVKAHRGQVMRKMRANSLADLVAMATRLGLRSLRTH
jgi:FixJ family two-component response regulator